MSKMKLFIACEDNQHTLLIDFRLIFISLQIIEKQYDDKIN